MSAYKYKENFTPHNFTFVLASGPNDDSFDNRCLLELREGKGWIFGVQLRAALYMGVENFEELTITRKLSYKGAPLFNGYVNTIYALRAEAKRNKNDVENLLYKILLNSLFGKFSQKQYQNSETFSSLQDAMDYYGQLMCHPHNSNVQINFSRPGQGIMNYNEGYEADMLGCLPSFITVSNTRNMF